VTAPGETTRLEGMLDDIVEEAVDLHDDALRQLGAGDPAAAEPLCRLAVALLEQELGPDSADVANVLGTLGLIRGALDDHAEAEALHRRALAILYRFPVEPVVEQLRVHAMRELAGSIRARGRYAEAERLLRDALALAERSESVPGEDVAGVLNNLAVVYKYTGRFDDAEALYRRALVLTERAHGSEHPDVATIYHNLGGLDRKSTRLNSSHNR
jgi:tetratricopeptide (TPR) repeat protein